MDSESLRFQRPKLPDMVLEQLMDWIMDGKIHMGQRLNSEELAQQLGVSRMPVREALNRLEKLGLVESIPYVGSRVVELNGEDVRQLYIVRQALEPVAAYYACERITDAEIAEIEQIQAQFEEIMKQSPPSAKQIYMQNRAFHFAIYQVCGMPRLINMIQILWDNLAFYKLIYGRTYVNDKRAAKRMVAEHRNYIEHLRLHDAKGLKRLLERSLERRTVDVPYRVSSYIDDKEHLDQAIRTQNTEEAACCEANE